MKNGELNETNTIIDTDNPKSTLTEKLTKLQVALENALEKKKKDTEYIDKIKLERSRNGKWLLIIVAICLLTGLCTPIGDTPYTYLMKTREGTTTNNISEHLPLTIAQNKEFAIFFIITLFIAIFTKIKLRLSDWFMLVGLIILAFLTRRQVSFVYLIGTLAVGKLIIQLIEKYDEKGTEEMIGLLSSIYGAIITISIVLIMSITTVKPKLDDNYMPENWYPIKASDYILENVDINNMKLFNEYNYGSYLLYRGIPVFIDSRADLYTPEFNENTYVFNDFLDITGLSTSYESKFEEYGITHIILYKNSKLNLLLEKDSNYNTLYTDNNFRVYERLNANVNFEED